MATSYSSYGATRGVRRTPTPGPGSEVFAPTKPSREGTNTLALLGGIAQILSSVVAIVVVFRR